MNQKFDVILFADGDTTGYDCYKNAVEKLLWQEDCQFAEGTKIYTHQDRFSFNVMSIDQIGFANQKVIIDNTPLPQGGAFSEYVVTAQTTVRSEYNMMYNIKSLAIYCGLACLLLLTCILGQCYQICKLRKDTNHKRQKLKMEYGEVLDTGNKDKAS